MDNQEKIENLITVSKTFARRIEELEFRIKQLEYKSATKSSISAKQYNDNQGLRNLYKPDTDKEVTPAMYKRVTVNLQELQSMFKAEDTWEINFIQGILDFTGQTVTEKQYDVLKTLAERVEYEKELAIKR